MKQVGVYEAKTQLPRLLEQVEQGETVVITRHGKPVARLTRIGKGHRNIDETIAALRAFRDSHPLEGITIKELINEGRRR